MIDTPKSADDDEGKDSTAGGSWPESNISENGIILRLTIGGARGSFHNSLQNSGFGISPTLDGGQNCRSPVESANAKYENRSRRTGVRVVQLKNGAWSPNLVSGEAGPGKEEAYETRNCCDV